MPTVTCPHCGRAASLPDPWTAPGYTCPHCRAAVSLAAPAATTPSNPFADIDDAPRRPSRPAYRPAAQHEVAVRGSFGTGFGLSFGCLTGIGAFFLGGIVLLVVMCAGGIHLGDRAKEHIQEEQRRLEEQERQEKQEWERKRKAFTKPATPKPADPDRPRP